MNTKLPSSFHPYFLIHDANAYPGHKQNIYITHRRWPNKFSNTLTINVSQKSHQIILLNGLERNANDMTNEFTYRIIESGDIRNEISHSNFQPEQREVTRF